MRARLILVFFIPLMVVLLGLGGAYAWASARSVQQEFSARQLGDLSSFVTSARHALRAGSAVAVAQEAERFAHLFDSRIVIVDAGGTIVAQGPADAGVHPDDEAQVRLALSGRRSDPPSPVPPWAMGSSMLIEPVLDDGDVIGAVLLEAPADVPRARIIAQWIALAAAATAALLLGLYLIDRIAHWVLLPVRRLDRAMAAIEHGDIDARIDADTGPPELRRITRAFNEMAEEIERSLTRERQFAQNASHELRNPLGALLVRVESLATGLDESWAEDVEAARDEGRRMTRILDALLALARSGRGGTQPAALDLTRIAQGRVQAWQDAASARGIEITARAGDPVRVTTDATIIEGALDAVIDNAVKFSPRGGRIEVRTTQDTESVAIVVTDQGPGLSETELVHATERFWRSPHSRHVPGSGLGLAIVTEVLGTLGGTLELVSAEGVGLCATLRLPRSEGP